MNLQDLMDQAWILACQQLEVEDADQLTPSEFQTLNNLQSQLFEGLGGNLEQYYESVL
jgi:hypothetical protein